MNVMDKELDQLEEFLLNAVRLLGYFLSGLTQCVLVLLGNIKEMTESGSANLEKKVISVISVIYC